MSDIIRKKTIGDDGRLEPLRGAANAVILFLRWPEKGRVKTRLSTHLAGDLVVKLYRCFVEDMIETVDRRGYPAVLCHHPASSGPDVRKWLGDTRVFLPQQRGDLGRKMAGAFKRVFSGPEPRVKKAVLVGTDLPDLPGAFFDEAFAALDTKDAVIGPSVDGGYYLIGFRSDTLTEEVFADIPWSTETVFEKTRERLCYSGRSFHLLPQWRDIDEMDDLKALMKRGRSGMTDAARTMALLEKKEISTN